LNTQQKRDDLQENIESGRNQEVKDTTAKGGGRFKTRGVSSVHPEKEITKNFTFLRTAETTGWTNLPQRGAGRGEMEDFANRTGRPQEDKGRLTLRSAKKQLEESRQWGTPLKISPLFEGKPSCFRWEGRGRVAGKSNPREEEHSLLLGAREGARSIPGGFVLGKF